MDRTHGTLVSLAVILAAVLVGPAGPAYAADHSVSGSTTNEIHQLILVASAAQCDPSNGDVSNPDDPNWVCRYAIRGHYKDTSADKFLGSGRVNGRFTFNTNSFNGTIGGSGCFLASAGVVKFKDKSGNLIRFKIDRTSSTICQTWDGTTDGPDGVRTEPTRTIHLVLATTRGGCVGTFCGAEGNLTWDSTATFDSANPGLFRYLNVTQFEGTVSDP